MSRNGTGTYNLPAGNPVVTGSTISSTWANSTLTDIASALTSSVASDGQTTPTANLPMGGYAHTGVANAVARTMYASAAQVQDSTLTYLTSVTGTSAITATAPAVLTAYAAGQVFNFIAVGTNSGATTININSIGVKSIVRTDGTVLRNSDLVAGTVAQIMYDGTKFQLISDINNRNSNVTLGYNALLNNTSGNNVAIGGTSLYSNTSGGSNVAIGSGSLYSSISGGSNVAIGQNSLRNNIIGNNNVAIGESALALSTGSGNIGIGYVAMTNSLSGNDNVGIGYQTLAQNTTGSYNVALSKQSLLSNTTGSGNIAIGSVDSIGDYTPVFNPTIENNRLCLGNTSITNAYVQVAWTVVSDARDKTDFAPVPHGLDFVAKLKPTAYRYKMNRDDTEGHGVVRYGFKAQEVLELEGDTPVIVDVEDAEKLKLNDQSMIAVLVNAIQELNAKFEEYKASHP